MGHKTGKERLFNLILNSNAMCCVVLDQSDAFLNHPEVFVVTELQSYLDLKQLDAGAMTVL